MKNSTEKRAVKRNSAFTLVELLLVVAIIGVLAAVVVKNLGGQSDNAKITTTRASIKTILSSVTTYEIQRGKYPESIDDMTAGTENLPPLLKKDSLVDPWNTPFQFKKTGKYTCEVRSAGPDTQMGTEDDIWDTN